MTLQVTQFANLTTHNGDAVPIMQVPIINATTSLAAAGTYTVAGQAEDIGYLKLTADAAAHVIQFGTANKTLKLLSGETMLISAKVGTVITVVS